MEEQKSKRGKGVGVRLNPSIPFGKLRAGTQDDPSIPQGERPRADLKVGAYVPPQGERARRKGGGGPKTEAGKAVVARNAIKHGVLAQTPVVTLVESVEDWERLRSGVFEYLQVEGTLEEALADRIAGLIWRL